MESTQGNPTRKRRRLLIVMLALGLVSLTSWWHWPRGDARFVGDWTLQSTGQAPNVRSLRWTLHSNGSGVLTINTLPNSTHTLRFFWRIEGDRFLVGTRSPLWLDRLLSEAQGWLIRAGAPSFIWRREEYDIINVSPEELLLRTSERPEVLTLTRIPE
jgi:hypothetical protein